MSTNDKWLPSHQTSDLKLINQYNSVDSTTFGGSFPDISTVRYPFLLVGKQEVPLSSHKLSNFYDVTRQATTD